MSQKQIFFIRHGETDWNRNGLIQGQRESSLSSHGFEQSSLLAHRLKKEEIQIIYSSPLKRAKQTSDEIKKIINAEIILDDDLMEISLGSWEGLNKEKVRSEYPLAFEKWLKKPEEFKAPCGESWQDVKNRADNFLERIITRSQYERILLSSHNGFGKIFMITFLEMSLAKFWNFSLDNGGVSLFVLHDNGRREIALLNDCCHLEKINAFKNMGTL